MHDLLAGEFLLDLTHTTYPPYDKASWQTREYWKEATARPLEVLLALESEWGNRRSPMKNLADVMYDAAKLAAVRARAKVLVFASQGKSLENRKDLVGMLKNLREKANDSGTPWLLIDMPWELKKVAEIHFVLL